MFSTSPREVCSRKPMAVGYQGSRFLYRVRAKDWDEVRLVDVDTVIRLYAPDDEAYEYLTCLDGSCWCEGMMSGLMKALTLAAIP